MASNPPETPEPDRLDTLATDPSLLRKVANPDDAASWAEFDQRYRSFVTRLGLHRGLNPAEAELVASNVMIQMIAEVRRFVVDPSRGRFRSLLRVCFESRANDLHRTNKRDRLRWVSPDLNPDQERDPFDTLPDRDHFAEWIDQEWKSEVSKRALQRLAQRVENKRHFQIYESYFINDQPASEVARDFAVSAAHVYLIKLRVASLHLEILREIISELEPPAVQE